eukprot:Filipodium_phascolosomae@DN7775_c0_g1_i1.p1
MVEERDSAISQAEDATRHVNASIVGAEMRPSKVYLAIVYMAKPEYAKARYASLRMEIVEIKKGHPLTLRAASVLPLVGGLLSPPNAQLSEMGVVVASKEAEKATDMTVTLTPQYKYEKRVTYILDLGGSAFGASISREQYNSVAKQEGTNDKMSEVRYFDAEGKALSCFSRTIENSKTKWSVCDGFKPENTKSDALAYQLVLIRSETSADHAAGEKLSYSVPVVNPTVAAIKGLFGAVTVRIATSSDVDKFYSFVQNPYSRAVRTTTGVSAVIVLLVAGLLS